LKIGQPLVSPTRKGRRSSGGGRDEGGGAGGIALAQMDGAENLLSGGDSDGFSGGEEEGKQYLLDFDSPKHNARLLENIRNQVEAELKGISHGGELVDMVSGEWR
jgi:flagellar biosynthesis/type III secretory pathway protein FliH